MLEIVLIVVIIVLLVWIFFGAGAGRTLELAWKNRKLRKEIDELEEINRILRSSIGSARRGVLSQVNDACEIAENLQRLKEALLGNRTARKALQKDFAEGPSSELVHRILEAKPEIDLELKRHLVNVVLIGDLGLDVLRSLNEGKSIADAAADAGVPVHAVRSRITLLRATGYIDNRLDLTDSGRKAIGLL